MNLVTTLTIIFYSIYATTGTPGYRLSNNVLPTFYALKLHPNLDEETFKGEESIWIEVKSPTQFIELHSCQLNIDNIYLDRKIVDFVLIPEFQLIQINKTFIEPGNHQIHIKYHGKFQKKQRGIFRTTLTENNKTVSTLVMTDFEPTYARMAFPCFDEPSFKAKFQLTLVVPNKTYTALSNMRSISIFETYYGVVYKFEVSKCMSTYLFSFAITQYNYVEYPGQIPIRVYSYNTSNETNTGAMEYLHKSLEFFNHFTNFKYPLPKIDVIEYDRHELNTATENWGLITIRKGFLSSTMKIYDNSQIVNVLAHEIAHSWFGNLVTNYWWEDIWLHESLATYLAMKAEEEILQRNTSSMFAYQYYDSLFWGEQRKPHNPIVQHNILTPEQLEKRFDDIIYYKGCAVLLMIEMVIGKDNLQCALKEYISRYAYQTATTNDFVNIIEKIDPLIDLRGFIESYLYQNRYPVIRVSENNDSYILKQSVCCHYNNSGSLFGYKWTVPVTYITNLDKSPKLKWFDKDMDKVIIPKSNEKWIKFNYKQIGFYRTNYDQTLWNKFDFCEFNEDDKVQLLSEMFYTLDTNEITCGFVLERFQRLCNCTRFNKSSFTTVLFVINVKFSKLLHDDPEALDIFLDFLVQIIEKTGRKASKEMLRDNFKDVISTDEFFVTPRPEVIASCTQWIKTNLRNLINNGLVEAV